MGFLTPRREIAGSEDLTRILGLPRRTWSPEALESLASRMTAAIKLPHGTQSLRPVQALALHDLAIYRGLFGAIRVGGGKTLFSALAAHVLRAKRPMLLIPAALVDKTLDDFDRYAKHWPIPRHIRILSYDMLSRVAKKEELTYYRPDLLVCDEAHRIKNKRAAVTKRVARYLKESPECVFACLSGTMMSSSLRDFAHLVQWSLKSGAPVPLSANEVDDWADALDEQVRDESRRAVPGALLRLADPSDVATDPVRAARLGFCRRLLETPGVVSAPGGEGYDGSLLIESVEYPVSRVTEENFVLLRESWELPGGQTFKEAIECWAHARQLALGMHHEWDPPAPADWRAARRAWFSFVRQTLTASRTLDSELQVREQVDKHPTWDQDGTALLRAWQRVEPTFTPNSVAVWHDTSALDFAAKWASESPGIVWTEHAEFARELSRRTGLRYFGEEGKDESGLPVEKADPRESLIASVFANAEGRNLQAWNRNLITACPPGSKRWQQLLGRTHRDGQRADSVSVLVLVGCWEHVDGWDKALAKAEATRDMMGESQKLLLADKVFHAPAHKTARWKNTPVDANKVANALILEAEQA